MSSSLGGIFEHTDIHAHSQTHTQRQTHRQTDRQHGIFGPEHNHNTFMIEYKYRTRTFTPGKYKSRPTLSPQVYF